MQRENAARRSFQADTEDKKESSPTFTTRFTTVSESSRAADDSLINSIHGIFMEHKQQCNAKAIPGGLRCAAHSDNKSTSNALGGIFVSVSPRRSAWIAITAAVCNRKNVPLFDRVDRDPIYARFCGLKYPKPQCLAFMLWMIAKRKKYVIVE